MKRWTTNGGCSIHRVLWGRSNVYLVSKDNMHLLIDSAVKSDWSRLNRRLSKILADKRNIDALILTHTHFDHAQNAFAVKGKYNAEIIVNKDEAEGLEQGANPAIKGTNIFGKFAEYLSKTIKGNTLNYQPIKPDVVCEDKYDLGNLGINVYIMHTPGHSQGSSSIIVDNEIALVGDAMFGIFKNSIFPPFAQQTDILLQSWEKLIETGCRLFLPGHGAPVSRKLLQKEYLEYSKINSSKHN